MDVCFNGFGENVLTFIASGTINAGDPVMISANGTVVKASGSFCGICLGVRNGYAAVQVQGYAKVAYSSAPSVGYAKISASGGKIAPDNDTGREYLVIDVDTTALTAGIML